MKTSVIRIMVFLAAFLSAPLAYAEDAGFTALAPIPGLTDKALVESSGFADFFNKLYIYLIGAAVILAIIMIVWGGLEYSTQDSISKKSDGKSKIYNALFGLVLVLSPVLVFTIINPQILSLNLNFPALKTRWGDYVPPVSDTDCVGNDCNQTRSCSTNDCAALVSGCKTGIGFLVTGAMCVRSDGTSYSPGTLGAPSGSCDSVDSFKCSGTFIFGGYRHRVIPV